LRRRFAIWSRKVTHTRNPSMMIGRADRRLRPLDDQATLTMTDETNEE
jgi:hypothetical protein